MQQLKYKRILLKLSGEALMGDSQHMFDKPTIEAILTQIKQLIDLGAKVGIVIGGGNIFRGTNGAELGLERANADYMGMLATIMNGIALKDFLTEINVDALVFSALAIPNVVKLYNRENVLAELEAGKVVIFVAGTGNPFFTTDSGAALRAIEINADLLIKATKVDGVYDMDPLKYPQAKKYTNLSFDEAISKNLKVMDMSAFDLCRAHKVNIEVCNIFQSDSLKNSVLGKCHGTLVHI